LRNFINVTDVPPSPHLAYQVSLNDATLQYELIPIGSRWAQLALWILLALIPILTGMAAVIAYLQSFSQIKFNQTGVTDNFNSIPLWLRHGFKRLQKTMSRDSLALPKFQHSSGSAQAHRNAITSNSVISLSNVGGNRNDGNPLYADAGAPGRRTLLIATMEYDIEDWGIKIKIGWPGSHGSINVRHLVSSSNGLQLIC
jgi:alpha-1,3-glucan synthase